MTKKILSVLTALVMAIGIFSLVPIKASAAVQRVDRTGGRDDGTWLFPLDQGYFNSFTDWAGCLNGYCKLCGGNHANDGSGDPYHTVAQFNGAGHNGVDIGASYGANVMASAAGTVRSASWNGSRGLTVIIEHPISGSNMSYFSYYQHLSSVSASINQTVSAGSVIGKVGNSGGDYGTHLHFGMVLAEKNCNIVNSLYSIECSNVLTKADVFSKRGIILTNPSVRSVFPQGYNGVVQHAAYHSGSISYTFDKSEVNIGSAASSAVTQTFDAISEGTYFLYNRATDLALNLGWNNDANCQNVHAYEYSTTNRGELMSITSCSDGKTYKIRPIDTKRLVQMYGESPYNGVNVCIYDDLENSTQWWRFKKVGNGYAILIDCNTNYALSSVSGNAVLNTYTGAGNQIWELIPYNTTYTVNYNANGGSGTMSSATFSVGHDTNLAANKFTRAGFTFQGWAKTASATTAAYSDKASVADLADGASSVTLYAVWKQIEVPQLSGLKATDITSNSITLSWDKVDADGYEIRKDNELVAKMTSNSFTFTGLKPATTYILAVQPYVEGASYSVGCGKKITTLSNVETVTGSAAAGIANKPQNDASAESTDTKTTSTGTNNTGSENSGSNSAASSSTGSGKTSESTNTNPNNGSGSANNAAQTAGFGAAISSSIDAIVGFFKKFFGK